MSQNITITIPDDKTIEDDLFNIGETFFIMQDSKPVKQTVARVDLCTFPSHDYITVKYFVLDNVSSFSQIYRTDMHRTMEALIQSIFDVEVTLNIKVKGE